MASRSFRSRLIRQVDYDDRSNELLVSFTNGDVVRYVQVPKYIHLGLLSARTPSKFFNRMVKPNYRAEIVTEVDEEG